MRLNIIELWGADGAEHLALDYARGMVDLGLSGPLVIVGTDGRVRLLRADRAPEEHPDLVTALDGEQPSDIHVLTVAVPPIVAEDVPRSSRVLLQDATISEDGAESLLLCPATEDDATSTRAFEAVANSAGRTWHRRLLLSPEDQHLPGDVAQPVADHDLVFLAMFHAAVLAGAVDPAMSAERLPTSARGEFHAVRSWVRHVDVGGVTQHAVAEVLELGHPQIFDGELAAPRRQNPDEHVAITAESLIDRHDLRYDPPPVRLSPVRVALSESLAMLWRFAVLRRPFSVRARLEQIGHGATGVVLNGLHRAVKGSVDAPVILTLVREADDDDMTLDQGMLAYRSTLASELAVEPVHGWLPQSRPQPRPALWPDLCRTTLGVLDGHGDAEREPVIDDPTMATPALLDPVLALRLTRLDLVDEVEHRPLRSLLADPWRTDDVLTLLAPGGTDTEGDEGEGDERDDGDPGDEGGDRDEEIEFIHAALTEAAAEAERSLTWQVGSTIRRSTERAVDSFNERVARLKRAWVEAAWTSQPERMAAIGLTILTALGVGGLSAVGYGWQREAFEGRIAGGLAVAVATVLMAAIAGLAARYAAQVKLREERIRLVERLYTAATDDWRAIATNLALYRQYVDWSTILQTEIHHPVGGRQDPATCPTAALRPRRLTSTQDVSLMAGFVHKVQRNVFQRGWRNRTHDFLVEALLTHHRHRLGLSKQPDPHVVDDDAQMTRQAMLTALIDTAIGDELRYRKLADQVLEGMGPDLVDAIRSNADRVEADGATYPSIDEFLRCDGDAPFSGFGLTHSPLTRVDGTPGGRDTEVKERFVTGPAGLDVYDASRVTGLVSASQGTTLVACRVDVSYPLVPRTDPNSADGGPIGGGRRSSAMGDGDSSVDEEGLVI